LQQQATALISTGRRASLTAKELSALPDGTHTYQSVGRACVRPGPPAWLPGSGMRAP